jgi:hypothetical protein
MAQTVQTVEAEEASSYELPRKSWIYSLLLVAMSPVEVGATLVNMVPQETGAMAAEEALATTGMSLHDTLKLSMSELNNIAGQRPRLLIGRIPTATRIHHTGPSLE